MREIEFRGKQNHNGEWLYGDLLRTTDNTYIFPIGHIEADGHHIRQEDDGPHWVIPETVGQYTGLNDKNGTKIFEGDIVKWKISSTDTMCGVVNYYLSFFSVLAGDYHRDLYRYCNECSVTGNVHD